MPYSNNGGPWGGNDKKGGDRGPWGGGNRPGGNNQVPDLDRIVKKGQEQLRVLMGGRGPTSRQPEGGRGIGRGGWALGILAVLAAWLWASFYTVQQQEESVELFFGEYFAKRGPGLQFAPWPVVTYEKEEVKRERVIEIGQDGPANRTRTQRDSGLMLTGDENIVDINFQVVWRIAELEKYLFNLRKDEGGKDDNATIRAVAESAMREVIGRSQLAPILNRDRAIISQQVQELTQATLTGYDSGIEIVRVNFNGADPPREVIDAFRDVQAAEQERDRFQKEADAYANQRLAEARGEAAQLVQQAEAYRAQAVNEAEGEASRFKAVYAEYERAKDVTRRRLYLETMERVLKGVNKVVIDQSAPGQPVVPYLPLNDLRKPEVRP